MRIYIILSQMLVLVRNSQTGDTQSTEAVSKGNALDNGIEAMRGHSSGNSIGNTDGSTQHTVKGENSNTLVNQHDYEKNEQFRYGTSCFSPEVIQSLIMFYRDLYFNDLDMQEVINAFNIENNIYYIYYKLLKCDNIGINKKFECHIKSIRPYKSEKIKQNLLKRNNQIDVKHKVRKSWESSNYPLLSDADIMKFLFADIEWFMIELLRVLYGNMVRGHQNIIINFDTVRNGSVYIKFYRALVLMNIISLDSNNDCVKLYRKKAIKVYKSYIVGMDLLGKTCKRFEDILSTSIILFKSPDDNEKKPEIIIDIILIEKVNKNYVKDTLKALPSHSDRMLEGYLSFCEKLCVLDKNLKIDCLTEAEWDQNIIDLERNCTEMNSILIECFNEVEKTTCYEGKCTLLRIYAELRDCIFQSIDMKSKCIKDSLCLVTFKGGIEKPVYNEEKENTCQGEIKAEDFLDELDKIKKKSGIPNPEKWKNSTLKEYLEANPGRSNKALEKRKSRNDKTEKNSHGIP